MATDACDSSAHVPDDMTSEWRLIISGNPDPPRRLMEEALARLLEEREEPGLVTIDRPHPVVQPRSQGSTNEAAELARELAYCGSACPTPIACVRVNGGRSCGY